MSEIDTEAARSGDGRETMDDGRETSTEKRVESLTEELAEAKMRASEMAKELRGVRVERRLMQKLAAAGAVDVEAAVLIAKARIAEDAEADLDAVIGQLRKEKQYLFSGSAATVTAKKTAGAKERSQNSGTILERAARKAAVTGNRADLHEYLKLRRNYV